jgi:hypothetical protein
MNRPDLFRARLAPMTDELDQIINRLRTAPLAERLAVDFEPRELPEHDPRLATIAELLLEAPRSDGEWSRFYGLEHQLPDPQFLGTDAAEPEWSAAAQRTRIVERLGEPFKAIAMATRAVANGAPRGPWARFLDTEAAAAWEAPSLLFSPWEVADARAHIAPTVPSMGPARTHRIAAVLEVSSEEGAAWSVIPDGGSELMLREEDMCELERAFGRRRYELGGRDVSSSALTPERALLEPLLALRVPTIEAFVARLVRAIDRGLSANSIAPLQELFAAKPSVAPAVVWFAQAIVGKDHAHAVTWNESAAKALQQLVGPDTELDLQAVRSMVGPYGLLLACYRGEAKLGIQIGNAGRVSLTTGEGWTPAELAET